MLKAVLLVQSSGLQSATGRQVEIKQTESAVMQDSKTKGRDFRQRTGKQNMWNGSGTKGKKNIDYLEETK